MTEALQGFDGPIGEQTQRKEEFSHQHDNEVMPQASQPESSLAKAIVMLTATDESQLEWRSRAHCLGPQSRYFFAPYEFEHKEQKEYREGIAKDICMGCPVKKPCLEQAINNKEKDGIWGGMNEQERKASGRAQKP